MSGTVHAVLAEARKDLESLYGSRLRGLYLFGSYARDEADRESDVDLLVVLGAFDRYGEEVDRTGPLVSRLSLTHGVSISTVFLTEANWKAADTPFLANVREEAVPA